MPSCFTNERTQKKPGKIIGLDRKTVELNLKPFKGSWNIVTNAKNTANNWDMKVKNILF
jgi:hypothetical protein